MNRRQWKKACKKAAAGLAHEFPGEFAITPADGTETLDAPAGYVPPRNEGKLGRRYTSPPKGTPVVWGSPGYYDGECSCRSALSVYAERRAIEDTDWDALWKEEQLKAAA